MGGGTGGERVQENGASLHAMNILPAITHNQENKESVFSKKPGGRVFFMDLLHFFSEFSMNFVRISRQIPEKSNVFRFFNQICENELENCRKF